jgi:hypothetical protein
MSKSLDDARMTSLADKIREQSEDELRTLSEREQEEAKIKRSKKPVKRTK